MEFTFNSEHFMRHQVSNLYSSPQEFLKSVHELVDLPQKVMNSPPNSFQELIDSPQETLCDETCDEMRDEMRDEMCDEIYNGTYDEVHDETYDEVHDETHDEVHETHKGQDLVGINGALPHINKAIVFAIDDIFPNWSIAEHYVAEYGRQKGFVPIKIRNKTDRNRCLINLYYKCKFSRTYQPKKTNNLQNQHNKGSKKLNCDWKANLSFATGVVQITSFNDNHVEHQLSPDTKIFAPINHRFSDDCHEEIRHLTVNGQCNLSTIRSLLSVKYPNQLFLTRDLANVVAQLRREHNVEGSKASQLLKQLYEYREKDPNWYIEPLVDSISNHFIKDFYLARNSLSESVFEARFTNLLNNYPATSSYLQKLFLSKESWACAYTFKIFTSGMQSTQRVEGLNNHIKTAINSSSTLFQVMEAIYQRIERESLSQRFNSWSQDRINYNDNLVLQTVFPQVVQQINKYLTPNLATEQQKQIVQSTIYRAQILNSWNSDLLNLQDVTYDDDFIENTYDVSQSYLLALIKENEYSSVKEVWRITCLISTKIDNVQENSFQKSVDKKLQFNKSMSLAKKAIMLQNSENDNELDTLLKNYIEKKTLQREKETKEREMRILRENYSSENVLAIETDDNQLISIDNVANLLNHIGKGVPKKNHIKGTQEDHTSKKKAKSGASTRLYGLCHEPNHYKSTCPQKKSNLEK
ncbi:8848_t:CDS:2 [Scutellospora calospora]|uniref:8848_t:CDS:1 n=1 Tax=Scutellospora calospora TaxID=85575 RepID=A0ACA9JUA0_9GLOM|nr:8848_t:CDS:2 [Scutellospora calospora]